MLSPLDMARHIVGTNATEHTEADAVVPQRQHQDAEARSSNPLRPRALHEMIGQEKLRRLLRRVIDAAVHRQVPLDHVLLVGGSGTGKSTIAHIIANELGVDVYQVEAPVNKATLLELRECMQDGDVLFVDEIHQQAGSKDPTTDPEQFFLLMEDARIATDAGMLEFPRISVIGATTDEGMLPLPFVNRFPLKPVIEAYTDEDMAVMAMHNAKALDLTIDDGACAQIGMAAGSTPRMVNNLVKNCASLSTGHVDRDLAIEVIVDLNGMTLDGLTFDQQNYLKFMSTQRRENKKDGDIYYQASVATIATAINKPRDPNGVTQRCEPLLIQRGWIQITNGGRRLTDAGLTRASRLVAGS